MMTNLLKMQFGTTRLVVDIPGPCNADGAKHAGVYFRDETRGGDIRYAPITWDEHPLSVNLGLLFTMAAHGEQRDLRGDWHKMYFVPSMACCYPKAEILDRIREIALFLDEKGNSDIPDVTLIADLLHMEDKMYEGQLSGDAPDYDTRYQEGRGPERTKCTDPDNCQECADEAQNGNNGDVPVGECESDSWGYADEDDEGYNGCEGHESLAGDKMGVTTYCDGSCVLASIQTN